MKQSGGSPDPDPPAGVRNRLRREGIGLVLLLVAVLFGAIALFPELRIGALPPNDAALHLAASERLLEHFQRGEPFLDPWVSEWALGYPLWRSYQPLPHLLGAGWLALTRPLFADNFHAFAALQYLLLTLLPVSFYLGARLLGLSALSAGLFALLALAPSAAGDIGRYGLSYGAFTWRGSGLFTQAVALALLLPTLGIVARCLDGRASRLLAAALLALTALAHIVFGYVGFLSAVAFALFGARGQAPRRIARLLSVLVPALLLLAWFVVPLFLGRAEVNHSRWEDAVKWDSYGWRHLLGEIVRARFLDAWRKPVLSLVVAAGVALALSRLADDRARRLLALASLWLTLYAGREAWGHLLKLVAMPAEFHIHRLQAAFEIAILLLAAFGLGTALGAPDQRRRSGVVLGSLALASALVYLGQDRWAYLAQNRTWGEESLAAWEKERGDLEAALTDVKAILKERPGRVSAGKAAEWGRDFKIGSLAAYAFTTREHLDQVSFLYHSMSLTADVMVHRNEQDLAHDVVFGVRAVLAPHDRKFPPGFRQRSRHGRFAVYEASAEGYFGLVDIGSRYTGPFATHYEPSRGFLESVHLRHGIVISLDSTPAEVPTFGRWQPIPAIDPAQTTPRGEIVAEAREGETYRATYQLHRPCYALLKITFHPDLSATVDGAPVRAVRVTPGFAAIPVPAGRHEVVVRYEPGPLRPVLLASGLVAFVLWGLLLRSPAADRIEAIIVAPAGALIDRLDRPRTRATLALILFALVAFRPLFRGRLISGHDATEYPPRLVEFARALGDGQIPPYWAQDLGNGRGQPLFAFAPPLVYLAGLPGLASGLKLADSIQFGLFLLHLGGAAAMYRCARRLGATRDVAVAVAACWCFAPYVSLDLFVRAAFAEAAAVAVSPIALWGLLRALEAPSARSVVLAAGAIALVPLGHNAAALLLFPALAGTVLAMALAAPAAARLKRLGAGALALGCGLGLSAFFWVPALLEKDHVKTHLLRQDFLHWSQHAVSWWQLLWSPWGFGLSQPGTADDGMSFILGPVHLALAAASLWLLWREKDARARYLGLAFALAAAAGAFLATTWSGFLWERIAILQYMAYPWRALGLPGLFLPLLALPALAAARPRLRWAVVGLLVILNLPHTEPKGYLTFDEEFYQPSSIASREIKTSTREEYEPRWVKQTPRYTSERLSAPGVELRVEVKEARTGHERLAVVSPAAVRAETASFYYPGFSITVNGIAVAVEPEPTRGTMVFALPAGASEVVIDLGPTPIRRAASLASLLTLVVLAGAALLPPRRD